MLFRSIRSYSNVTTCTDRNGVINRRCFNLDKSLILYEKNKVKTQVHKEIKALINKLDKDTIEKNLCEKCLSRNQQKLYSSTIGSNRTRTADDINSKKMKKKIFNDLNQEHHRMVKELLTKANEFQRIQLEKKVREDRYRIDNFCNKKITLMNLRQQIRKNINLKKYNIKSELEKSMIRYKVKFY